MLYIRRSIAVLFALVFFLCLMIVVVGVQASGKVASPGYVTSTLREADAYNFLYDDVMEAVLGDMIDQGFEYEIDLAGDEPVVIRFDDTEGAKRAIRGFVDEVMPREFLQERVEVIVDGTMNYAYGRSDEFEISSELPEMIRRVPQAVRVAAREINLGESLTRDVIGPVVRAAAADFTMGPLGIAFTPDEAVDAARRLLPPEWIEEQLFAAVDEMAPYFAGDRDSFAVNISFRDRVPIVADILKEKIETEGGAVDLLFERIVNPAVSRVIDSVTLLSFSVPITEEEVQAALEEVAPRRWIKEQAIAAVGSAFDYVSGDTDTLVFSVDLVERKEAAIRVLGDLAQSKLEAILGDIPRCRTLDEARRAASQIVGGRTPDCVDERIDLRPVLDTAIAGFRTEIRRQITERIPDRLLYTDTDFRSALDPDVMDGLDDLRETLRDGYTYTSEDLIDAWSETTNLEDVERILGIIRGSVTYDQADFEEDYQEAVDDAQEQDVWLAERMPDLETARGSLGRLINLRWLAFIVPLVLLLIVAFLGGRGWYGRLKWAAWPLFASSVIAAVLFGPVFQLVMSANSETWFDFSVGAEFKADWPATAALVESGVVVEKIEAVAGDVVGSMLQLSVVCLIVSLCGLAFAYLWPLRRRAGRG